MLEWNGPAHQFPEQVYLRTHRIERGPRATRLELCAAEVLEVWPCGDLPKGRELLGKLSTDLAGAERSGSRTRLEGWVSDFIKCLR